MMSSEPITSEFEPDKNLELDFIPTETNIAAERIAAPRALLLTGATGFIGSFLLAELLQQTTADVYCLVRAVDEAEARQRIQDSLATYQVWDDRLATRIYPVAGDLSLPGLGLSGEVFQALAQNVDIIYHNGALINFTYPYARLRAPNVLGTLEILKLACQSKIKPIHYISTLGVFSPAIYNGKGIIEEARHPERGETLVLGYTQSKWMAECLLSRARARGAPVCIHRLGRVLGHSQTGVCHTHDLFWKLIKACIRISKIPRPSGELELQPVDYVCQAITHISRQAALLGKNFHYLNPSSLPMSQFVQWMNDAGYWVEQVSFEQWRLALIDFAAASPQSNEASLAPLFWSGLSASNENIVKFDHQNTLAALAGSRITCHPVTPALLETYFSYFVRTGFLSPPVM